jgi:hypothetical protein
MGLKRNRRQRERDDVADDQAAITNANNLRTLENQDRRFSADQEQRRIVNAANEATALARDKRFTFDESKLDYQQAQDKIVNARNEGIDSEALKLRNQEAMRQVMNGFTQADGDGDAYLSNPSNIDSLNAVIKNSPSLVAQVKAANEKYEVAGIKRIPTTTNEDGSKNYRYALMIDTGEVDQERNPILKPLSSTRGTDDPVVAFTANETIQYIEQAILKESGSTTTQNLNSARTLASQVSQPQLGQAQQPVAAQAQAVVDTDTTTPSLANPNPQTDLTESASTYQTPEDNSVEAPLTNQQRVDELVLEAAAKYSDQASNLDPDIQKQLEDILLADVMSMTGANINDAQQMIMESRRNGGGPAEDPFSGYTGLNKTQATGRALGQFVDGAVDLGGAIAEGAEDLTDAVGNKFSEFGSAFSSSAETTPLADNSVTTTAGNTNAATTSNTKTSTSGALSTSAKKGITVPDTSAKVDNGGVVQAIVNKASTLPDLSIGASMKILKADPTKVDNSVAAQNKRAQAVFSLHRQKLIALPSPTELGNFVKNNQMKPNTIQTLTYGDHDYLVEKDGFGQIIGSTSTVSQEAKSRVQRLLAAGDTAGADLEKKRVKDVGTNWTQAAEIGMAAVGGNVKKDGEFGSTFGTVPRAGFENYFIGMMRSNANQVQSVLPKGMDINNLTGSNGELAVLAALSKATASSLQKNTWTSEDFTSMSGGNWMAILAEYPPAAASGLYVYGGRINILQDEIPGFMAANPGMTEPAARAALKKVMSDNAMAAKKAFEEARQS